MWYPYDIKAINKSAPTKNKQINIINTINTINETNPKKLRMDPKSDNDATPAKISPIKRRNNGFLFSSCNIYKTS